MNIPESEVARLGDEERIRAHYSDELSINELLSLAEHASELAARWEQAPQPERDKFLKEREAVLAQGDQLASRPPGDVSPLLRDELARARADWQRAREAVARLR